jgi:glycosyltransferase involved in cell wall biosynthesis
MGHLVSVIVPCYDQAQYLSEALQSVVDQTYSNWECIIVNDGSPDNTVEVAKKWLEKDSRFKYIYKENGGLSSARNAGIEIAEGEFILPLDADDRIGTNYLSLAVDEFKKDSELKVVYCKAEKFGDEVGEWKLPCYSIKNLAINNMIFCSAIFKRADWERTGGYDVNMIYGLEDWEFWIALLKGGGGVKQLSEVCFYYRMKSGSMIQRLTKDQFNYSYEYLSIKHADFFVEQYGSFQFLNEKIYMSKKEVFNQLKSKKYVVDLFCKTFLGFTVFNKSFKL